MIRRDSATVIVPGSGSRRAYQRGAGAEATAPRRCGRCPIRPRARLGLRLGHRDAAGAAAAQRNRRHLAARADRPRAAVAPGPRAPPAAEAAPPVPSRPPGARRWPSTSRRRRCPTTPPRRRQPRCRRRCPGRPAAAGPGVTAAGTRGRRRAGRLRRPRPRRAGASTSARRSRRAAVGGSAAGIDRIGRRRPAAARRRRRALDVAPGRLRRSRTPRRGWPKPRSASPKCGSSAPRLAEVDHLLAVTPDAGAQAARAVLLRTWMQYLTDLQRASGSTERELLIEVAKGYRQLAAAHGGLSGRTLGDRAGATRTLQIAENLWSYLDRNSAQPERPRPAGADRDARRSGRPLRGRQGRRQGQRAVPEGAAGGRAG